MFSRLKPFIKANRFVNESYKNYVSFSSPSEKTFDILFPVVISILFTGATFWLNNPLVGDFLKKIDSLNASIITAISILAGFNFAGVSVISSSQSDLVNHLKNKKSKKDPNTSLFKILMIFFTWSIVVELLVVCIGIFLYFSSQFFVPSELFMMKVPIWIWAIITGWMSVVIHSLFLSIRNIKMLFLFITRDYKATDLTDQDEE